MGSHNQNYNTYKVYKYTSPSKKIYIGQTQYMAIIGKKLQKKNIKNI